MMIAQNITVTGTITDEKDESIPGANVVIKGSTRGTVSDVDGNFAIMVSNENSVLIFSFLGFVSQEITVGNQKKLSIVLREETRELDEVVVVAYGSQKKVSVTGAISTV
jgi:hypothetical protein